MSDQFKNVDVDDYLAMIGYRAKGTRGRLSERCKLAIETGIQAGMTFKNWDSENRKIVREKLTTSTAKPKREKSSVKAQEPEHFTIVRGANAMKITDSDGNETVLDYHPSCGKPVNQCRCRVVDAPSYYIDAKVELIQI